jgi:hypothetical protein
MPRNDWLTKKSIANYKAKVKEVIREFLTEDEIESMINKEFVSERLELVRDIFIQLLYRISLRRYN